MSRFLKLFLSLTALVILAGGIHSSFAASAPVPLETRATDLIHISTRPRSTNSVFVDVRIDETSPRIRDVRLKLSGLRLNVMRRTVTGEYESLVSVSIDTWRKDGALHAYFAIDPKLIETSTLDLVIDAPDLPGENYHAVRLNEFIKSDPK